MPNQSDVLIIVAQGLRSRLRKSIEELHTQFPKLAGEEQDQADRALFRMLKKERFCTHYIHDTILSSLDTF